MCYIERVTGEQCNRQLKLVTRLLRVKSHIYIHCHRMSVCLVGCYFTHTPSRQTAGVEIWGKIAYSFRRQVTERQCEGVQLPCVRSLHVCLRITVLCVAQRVMHVGVNKGGTLSQPVMSLHIIRVRLKQRQGRHLSSSISSQRVCLYLCARKKERVEPGFQL